MLQNCLEMSFLKKKPTSRQFQKFPYTASQNALAMKGILFTTLLSIIFMVNSSAQDLELQLDEDTKACFVQPTAEDGFLLFYQVDTVSQPKPPQLPGRKCHFRKYTAEFDLIWRKTINIPGRYNYESHFWDNERLYVLLSNTVLPISFPYMIISISGESGEITTAEGTIPYNFKLNDFSGVNGYAYIAGETKMDALEQVGRILAACLIIPLYTGVLQYDSDAICMQVDMATGKSRELPQKYYGLARAEQLVPNYRARAMTEVIFNQPDKFEHRVHIKEYAGPTLIRNFNLKPHDDHRPINITLNHVNRFDCIAAGSYAWAYKSQRLYRNIAASITGSIATAYPQGIYAARFSYNGQKFIHFYPFQLFEKFYEEFQYEMMRIEPPEEEEEEEEEEIDLSSLPPRQQRKMERKLERMAEREQARENRLMRKKARRPAKELLPDFKVLMHPPLEMKQDYLLVAELYRPSGTASGEESGGAIVIGAKPVASGFDHFHTLIAAIDKRTGTFSWETSFPFTARSKGALKPQIQIMPHKEGGHLLLIPEVGQLGQKLLAEDGTITELESIGLPRDKKKEEVKEEKKEENENTALESIATSTTKSTETPNEEGGTEESTPQPPTKKGKASMEPWMYRTMMFWSYEEPPPLSPGHISRSGDEGRGPKLVVKRVDF